MLIYSANIQGWIRTSGPPGPLLNDQIHTTRDLITTDEHFTSSPEDIFDFIMTLFKVLERTSPSPGQLPQTFSGCEFDERQKLALELFWDTFPSSERPEHTPLEKNLGRLEEAKRENDPENVEWYEEWTNTEEVAIFDATGFDFDPDFLENSENPSDLALSARILYGPKDGKLPSRENVEEAFEAIDKLFKTPGKFGNYFPGRKGKAVEILERASSKVPGQFQLHKFLDIPQLYELHATKLSGEEPTLKLLEDDELGTVDEELLAARTTRIEKGCKPSIHDVSMTELLRRFSEAAFYVHRDGYVKDGINSPREVLCEPLTEEEVAAVELEMGPLLPDLKEIVLIADGFHGGWHFAGSGWGGIRRLWREKAVKHEVCLGYKPASVKEMRMMARDDGNTYQVKVSVIRHGAEDPRRYWEYVYCVHLVCPEETWKKMQEAMGNTLNKGEYPYLHYAHWTGGRRISHSVWECIASMTVGLERCVAARIRAVPPDGR